MGLIFVIFGTDDTAAVMAKIKRVRTAAKKKGVESRIAKYKSKIGLIVQNASDYHTGGLDKYDAGYVQDKNLVIYADGDGE